MHPGAGNIFLVFYGFTTIIICTGRQKKKCLCGTVYLGFTALYPGSNPGGHV